MSVAVCRKRVQLVRHMKHTCCVQEGDVEFTATWMRTSFSFGNGRETFLLSSRRSVFSSRRLKEFLERRLKQMELLLNNLQAFSRTLLYLFTGKIDGERHKLRRGPTPNIT